MKWPLVSEARKCTEGAQRSFARAYLEGVQTGLGLSSSENFFSEKADAGAPRAVTGFYSLLNEPAMRSLAAA